MTRFAIVIVLVCVILMILAALAVIAICAERSRMHARGQTYPGLDRPYGSPRPAPPPPWPPPARPTPVLPAARVHGQRRKAGGAVAVDPEPIAGEVDPDGITPTRDEIEQADTLVRRITTGPAAQDVAAVGQLGKTGVVDLDAVTGARGLQLVPEPPAPPPAACPPPPAHHSAEGHTAPYTMPLPVHPDPCAAPPHASGQW
jgi:hypothetical protein